MERWVGKEAWNEALLFLGKEFEARASKGKKARGGSGGGVIGSTDLTWGEFLLYFVPPLPPAAAVPASSQQRSGSWEDDVIKHQQKDEHQQEQQQQEEEEKLVRRVASLPLLELRSECARLLREREALRKQLGKQMDTTVTAAAAVAEKEKLGNGNSTDNGEGSGHQTEEENEKEALHARQVLLKMMRSPLSSF